MQRNRVVARRSVTLTSKGNCWAVLFKPTDMPIQLNKDTCIASAHRIKTHFVRQEQTGVQQEAIEDESNKAISTNNYEEHDKRDMTFKYGQDK